MSELNETERMILRLLSGNPDLPAIAVYKQLVEMNPPQLIYPTLWNMETRGFVDSRVMRYTHLRVYWVTELGKEVLGGNSDHSISSAH